MGVIGEKYNKDGNWYAGREIQQIDRKTSKEAGSIYWDKSFTWPNSLSTVTKRISKAPVLKLLKWTRLLFC